jgi:Flp pilus assembly secretin CpaC
MNAILRAFALGVVLLLTTIPATRAAEQTIALKLGFGSALVLDRAFETILIGDSNVVDVRTRDDRSVFLEPLAPGATNLIFLDEQNIVIANIAVLVRGPAIDLVARRL